MSNEVDHIATIAAVSEQEFNEKILIALEGWFDSAVTICGEFEFSEVKDWNQHEFKAYVDGDLSIITIQRSYLY